MALLEFATALVCHFINHARLFNLAERAADAQVRERLIPEAPCFDDFLRFCLDVRRLLGIAGVPISFLA